MQTAIFLLRPRMVETEATSLVSLLRTQIRFLRRHTHDLTPSYRPHLQTPWHWG